MEVKTFRWNSLAGRMLVLVLLSLILVAGFYIISAPSESSPAIAGRELFDENCQSCHTIGGGALVGPDLKGVLDRRESEWVKRFIGSPDWVIAEGDPIALELLEEFNGVEMPNLSLTTEDVEIIISFMEEQANLTQASIELPIGNIMHGEKLFMGDQFLENGGTPCMACHTVGGVGQFGGGTLGPDLTHVFDRYGEPGLTSAMQNISFPTMKNVYVGKTLTLQETADLLAFFAQADEVGNEGLAESTTMLFWGVGAAGTFVLFGIMIFFWPRQSKNQTDRLRKKAAADLKRRNS
jgi:mono/diheme cytochrome c family protein